MVRYALRTQVSNYLEANKRFFKQFDIFIIIENDEGIDKRIKTIRNSTSWGGESELLVLSYLLNTNIKVYKESDLNNLQLDNLIESSISLGMGEQCKEQSEAQLAFAFLRQMAAGIALLMVVGTSMIDRYKFYEKIQKKNEKI